MATPTYTDKLKARIKNKGLKMTWLAKAAGFLRYSTFSSKLRDNTFSADEKKRLDILLGEDMEAKTQLLAASKTKAALKQSLKQFA